MTGGGSGAVAQTLKPLQVSSNIYHLLMSPHLSSQIPILFFSKRSKGSFSFSIHTRKGKTEEKRRGETGRMQSRLLVVVRWYSFFPLFPRCLSNYPLFTTSQCCGAGDPAVHSEFPQDEEAEEAAKATTAQKPILSTRFQTNQFYYPTSNIAHIPSSPKLENPTIGNIPLDPCYQQKRQNHNAPTRAIEEVDCVGWDGAPTDDQQWRDEEDDYIAHYKEHRPSPISEIEIADTRKPIRKATDGGVEEVQYGAGEDVKGWLPEQLDTAEEALLRAERMFWEAKERGDPDSPQSKVLRRLRGEDF